MPIRPQTVRPVIAIIASLVFTAFISLTTIAAAGGTNTTAFNAVQEFLGFFPSSGYSNEKTVQTNASLDPRPTFLTDGGSITEFGSALTENFDSLLQTGVGNTWTNNVTIAGAYSNRGVYIGDTGTNNSGGLYSYGVAGTNLVGDRALGTIASSGAQPVFAFKLTNNTSLPIGSLNVSYTGEQWRNAANTTAQTITFDFKVGNVGTIDLTSSGYTAVSALNFTGPIAVVTAGVLDGNAPANRVAKFSTITFSPPVEAGQEIWIRWTDHDDLANDHGLAVDDLTITAFPVAPTTQASDISFSDIQPNQLAVNWTNGNGSRRLVKINTSNSFSLPNDGSADPIANTTYGGAGEQVIFNGASNGATVTNLSASSTYWFRVYEYNGTGTSSRYLGSAASNNPYSQATSSSLLPASATITNSPVTFNNTSQPATVSCSGGGTVSGVKYDGSSTVPTNAATYFVTTDCAASATHAAGTNLPAGNFIISNATQTAMVTNSGAFTYDGSPHAATVSCSGGESAGGLKYDESETIPIDAGTYAVTADCPSAANYAAGDDLTAGDYTINAGTFTIDVTQTANGVISPDDTSVAAGGSATFYVVPDAGYQIDSVTVDGVAVANSSPYTFSNVTANHTITATFVAIVDCETISISDDLTSPTAVQATIPVVTTDVTGSNVIAAEFKLTYDPAVLSALDITDANLVTAGGVLPVGSAIDVNRPSVGVILVIITGATPFSGAGTLVNIHLNVIGSAGGPTGSTALTLSAIDPLFPEIFYNGGHVCAAAESGALSVDLEATETALTSSLNSSVYGDSVTFTATIAPYPGGGTVQFNIDGLNVGSPIAIDEDGEATYTTSVLTANTHPVYAVYSGFAPYAGSTSNTVDQIVGKAPSMTVTTCTNTTFVYTGSPITPCSAAVTGVNLSTTASVTYIGNTDAGIATANAIFGGDANHLGSTAIAVMFSITKAESTTTVENLTVEYDGSAHSTTATVSGVGTGITQTVTWAYSGTCSAAPVNVVETPCTATATYGGDANHTGSFGSGTITITKASSTVTVAALSVEYDGIAHVTTATVSGVGTGVTQAVTWGYSGTCSAAPVNVVETPCTATATYAGDGNHTASVGSGTITITKASSTVTVDAISAEYDGNAHTTTATVSGVGTGVTQAVTWGYSGTCSAAPVNVVETPCTATATYAGDVNHAGSVGSGTITITKTNSATTVDDLTVAYNGIAHTTTATVNGVGMGITQAVTWGYSGNCLAAPVNVVETPCTATATYAGDANHTGSSDSGTITITKASSTTMVDALAVEYDGGAHTTTATVNGVGSGITQIVTWAYSGNCLAAPVNVAETPCTATATYDGDVNHTGSSDSGTITINEASSTVTVAALSVEYDGNPHATTAIVGGVGTGVGQIVTWAYTGNCSAEPVHVAESPCTATATYIGDANHSVSAGANTISITKRPAVWMTEPSSKLFGAADPMPLTTGSGSGLLSADGVAAAYSRESGEAVGVYHITALLSATGSLDDYLITNSGADFAVAARTLTGNVTYENAAGGTVYVPQAAITASGAAPLPTPVFSGSPGGAYLMSGFGTAAYTITADKAAYLTAQNTAIFANDASMISRHVVHIETLTASQQKAARVSGGASITSFDASLLAQYIVGIPNTLNQAGRWKFDPVTSTQVIGESSVLDLAGTLIGDVNGNWQSNGSNRPVRYATPTRNAVIASLPVTTAAGGAEVVVPFRIDNLAGRAVDSYQFDITFDPRVIMPAETAAHVTGTLGANLSVVSNSPEAGLLKVAVYGAIPASGDGVYVDLKFIVTGDVGRTTPLAISAFRFNEGLDEITTTDGRIMVGDPLNGSTLRGRLVTATGKPVSGAIVSLGNAGRTAETLASDVDGRFEFSGLTMGETYLVSVTAKRRRFAPATVSVVQLVTELDMIADE